MTANRIISTFSVDERSAIYDYCIKHTEGPPVPEEFTLDLPEPKNKDQLSEKEKLALERDAKRRRTKYKSVHTSKKSQTEIMREVIDNQMTLYKQWIERKQEQEKKEREKLERLKNEKTKHSREINHLNESEQSNQFHYIETTYSQSNVNQNNVQWDQSVQYSENYGSQYYGNVPSTQGVITDWSHVYQAGIDTDIYADPGQYQLDGEYVEQQQITDSTNFTYENPNLSHLDVPSQACNGHSNDSDSQKEYLNKKYSELDTRLKEHSFYERKTVNTRRSREKDRQHEKEVRRHRSRERRKDRRH